MPSTTTPTRPRRAGYSLTELLVVIAIIVILVGLIIGVSATRQGPVNQTQAVLHALQNAQTEYAVSTNLPAVYISRPLNPANNGNPVIWGNDAVYVDAPGASGTAVMGANANYATDAQLYSGMRFVWLMLEPHNPAHNDAAEKAIRSIGSNNLMPETFGNFLVPLDNWGTPIVYVASNKSTDATYISTLPTSTRPFFASAGPDKQWGTADDLYSIDMNTR